MSIQFQVLLQPVRGLELRSGVSTDIRCEIKEQCLYLEVHGIYSLDAALEVFEYALEMAKQEKLRGVLIDTRKVVAVSPSVVECYEMGKRIAQLQSTRGGRVRLAVVGTEAILEVQRFGEVVALNRGALIKVSTDFEVAIAWLRQNTKGNGR